MPIVLHHHHLYPRWASLEAQIASRADAVITVSEHSREQLVAAGVPPARVHVVLEGVARPPVAPARPEAWPAADGLRLLALGRLEPRKRPEVAIDALAALRRHNVGASLVIAGDGPMKDALLKRTYASGVGDAVRFAGRVSDAEKWQLYDSADVLVFASTLEGFGLVVAEAQSRGVPVLAAQGTATAEALEPDVSGMLAEPDGQAFAARLMRLADADRRRQMSSRAREFSRRFDWDTCAAGVAEVYRSLVRPA